jgi:hypothetical protein
MNARFLAPEREEFVEAVAFYENEAPGLAKGFIAGNCSPWQSCDA